MPPKNVGKARDVVAARPREPARARQIPEPPGFIRGEAQDKIRVHALYCVLALTLTALVRRRLARQGITLSSSALISELSGVQRVAHLYPEDTGIKSHLTFSEMDPLQDTVMRTLELLPAATSNG